MAILRTIRTARHLSFAQILSRLRNQWERKSPADPSRWTFPQNKAPAIRADFAIPATSSARSISISLLSRGIFQHLNEERELGREKTNWLLGPYSKGRLWTVTLHYHRWLIALAHSIVE